MLKITDNGLDYEINYGVDSVRDVLLRHIEHLQSKMEWQKIETAPKDGTWVLVVVSGYLPTVAYWSMNYKNWLTEIQNDVSDEMWEGLLYVEYHPTHWMPLLESPKL